MKRCKNHYPIIGTWTIIEDDGMYKTWECPKCHERFTNKRRKGRIIKLRHREQAYEHRRDLIQPFLDEKKPNPNFAKEYGDTVNLREFYTDKEVKKMVGPKYLETHEPKKPLKADRHLAKLEEEVVNE